MAKERLRTTLPKFISGKNYRISNDAAVVDCSAALSGVDPHNARAADVALPVPENGAVPTTPDPVRKADSVFVFAGAMPTRNMGPSATFDHNWPIGPNYDNYIVGAAYNHEAYLEAAKPIGRPISSPMAKPWPNE